MDAILHFTLNLFLPFLLVITVLVFVHELGHYLVARWNGVKVDAFSIGMGPQLIGFDDKHGTRWKFCLFPIGGYVKMFGDADIFSRPEQEDGGDGDGDGDDSPDPAKGWAAGAVRRLSDEERAGSFHHKRVGQRFAIVLAGPMANFIFTIVVLFFMLLTIGQATTLPVVGAVIEDSPAERAGFLVGDRVIAIDGQEIDRFQDLQRIVQLRLDREMNVEILRDGATLFLSLTPELVEVEDITGRIIPTPRIGIAADAPTLQRLGVWDAAKGSITETLAIANLTLRVVGQIITGRRGTEELGGPVRIAELSGKMVENGAVSVIWFMALLSLNLGIINLFPIPVLDGGHLLFYICEWVRGKPLPERAQAAGYRIGLVLVLALFAFVFWNDLSFYWTN
ncbi:MAG: RIP metalloprotease RseP [Alphaproteobacteria bacterium]|nr:RIP metalloprotease RseP [Alphaproteobacteria bacterium]